MTSSRLTLPRRGRRVGATCNERGSAIVELTWLGLLLLVPLVYVIVTVFTVQRSAYGASEAVRAAARAYVLSPDVATANARAVDAAQLSMRDQGVQLATDDVVIRCEPSPAACLTPGSSVVVAIALEVRLPLAPSVLGQSAALDVRSRVAHRALQQLSRVWPVSGVDRRRVSRTDDGSITPLLIVFALCLALMIGAVIDVSAAYLRRQATASLADGAALSASDAAAAAAVYWATARSTFRSTRTRPATPSPPTSAKPARSRGTPGCGLQSR